MPASRTATPQLPRLAYVGQQHVRLHVCLRHLAIEGHLHAGNVAVIGEVHLRRDEPDGRAGPPHEPDE